jgi:hypothetical protein
MKKLVFIVFILMVGCANEEESQKYALLKQENAILMSQCDYIIKDQQRIVDNHGIEKEVFNALDVQHNLNSLKLVLGTQDLNYTVLQKANTRFGYLFRGKKSIKLMYIQRVGDTNKEINSITGRLSTKDYIYQYLPKEMQ